MKPAYLYSLVVLLVSITNHIASPARADNVYKWQDQNGVTHYSSTPLDKGMKPAELPPIMKGDMKLGRAKLENCEKHGGINCQLGPDTDGSVLCYDNFKGSTERFKFNCSSPELEIADISDIKEDGSFSVFVRNARSVDALEPSVRYKPDNKSEVLLKGPKHIEAFGLGEFLFVSGKERSFGDIINRPKEHQIKLACKNCLK